ncbi:MAG: putative sulfate exporter family transporter [Bacteroidota bacterium]
MATTQPNSSISKIIVITIAIICAMPFSLFCSIPEVTPPIALLMGLILSLSLGNPYKKSSAKFSKILQQVSIVGLGFKLNMTEAAQAGKEGLVFTICSISLTLIAGILIGKAFGIDKKITYLISSGTAICGGAAIAAVSPVIKAEEHQMSVALGTVFILNAIALMIFPGIGHFFNLSDQNFGLWAAIAIHDTSSVVGAAKQYSIEALKVATTVKLLRALWIIPLSLITAYAFKSKDTKIKWPYFIFYFLLAILVNTYLPTFLSSNGVEVFNSITHGIMIGATKGLTLTLFFIGTTLSKEALRTVGVKPLVLGVLLWILISVSSLMVILNMHS